MFLNQVAFEGRLGKDPESKTTTGGKNMCKSSLAIYNGKDKPPIWVVLVAWDKMAEILAETKKGDNVVVTGSLRLNIWEGNDGVQKSDLEVDVRGFSWGSKPHQNDPSKVISEPNPWA